MVFFFLIVTRIERPGQIALQSGVGRRLNFEQPGHVFAPLLVAESEAERTKIMHLSEILCERFGQDGHCYHIDFDT